MQRRLDESLVSLTTTEQEIVELHLEDILTRWYRHKLCLEGVIAQTFDDSGRKQG